MRPGWVAPAAAALLALGPAPSAARASDAAPVPFAAGDRAAAQLPSPPLRGREVSGDRSPGSVPPGARTVPSWSGSFTTDGVTYPYTMVGTDPARGSATTTVPVVLIPLRFQFTSDHHTLDDPEMAGEVTSSPLFTPMPFVTGTTQYPDAFQRGNLWSQVIDRSRGYHVLLGGPRVLDTQKLEVPRRKGVTDFNTTTNRRVGIVASAWLDHRLTTLLRQLAIAPDTLPVFLAPNVAGTNAEPAACLQPTGCEYFWGYHGAVAQRRTVQTFIYSTLTDYGDALAPELDEHEYALSHELIEWIDDPFVLPRRNDGQWTLTYNQAPRWTSAFYPACSDALEVADPLEGVAVSATPPGGAEHLLADGAFLPWFARETPSTAIRGFYDALGVLDGYSSAC